MQQYRKTDSFKRSYNSAESVRWQKSDTDTDVFLELGAYDAAKFASMRVFCVIFGTVVWRCTFWMEQMIFLLVFVAWIALELFVLGPYVHHMSFPGTAEIRVVTRVGSTMTFFLLSFFTNTNYQRWWRLRTCGVGRIWTAIGKLCFFLFTFVTKDANVISSVERYGRASLMMIFMGQRGETDQARVLLERGVLLPDEASATAQLMKSPFACIGIWTWIAEIVRNLWDEGHVPSDTLFWQLLQSVETGRQGAELIVAQLGCPLPMSYVAICGIITKTVNLFNTIGLARIWASEAWGDHQISYSAVLTFAEWWLLTGFFNIMLILNRDLMNPFDGTSPAADFPMHRYNKAIKDNMKNYMEFSLQPTPCLQERRLQQHQDDSVSMA